MTIRTWKILASAYSPISIDDLIENFYWQLENKMFLYNNFNLIWRCAERADLILEFQEWENFEEYEDILNDINIFLNDAFEYLELQEFEYELNLDSYISDLPFKLESESRDLGFL